MSEKVVRCKFKCQEMTKIATSYPPGQKFLFSYRFGVVVGDSEENKKFFASTPSGEFKVSSVRDDLFEVGKEYCFDISLAE